MPAEANYVFNTPVLFIIFNRPDTTQQVFNAIRAAKPPRLYVAADGPRAHVPADVERTKATRKIVEQVDWQCDVKTLFQEKNLNCGVAPSTAMTWFFEHETEGIILEDDCLPSPAFFRFCQELLERYRDDMRVMHIGGNNFLGGWSNDEQASYYFSRIGHIWGWATWRRAWKKFDYNITQYDALKQQGYFDKFFLNRFERYYRLRNFDKTVANRGKVDWWDYQWEFARYINSGLSIIPQKNLVKNLGFGVDATHTTNVKNANADMTAYDIGFPLRHPDVIIRDMMSDKKYFSNLLKGIVTSKLRAAIPFVK